MFRPGRLLAPVISYLLKKIVGSQNEREVRKLGLHAERINALEDEFTAIPTVELSAKTSEFRERIRSRVGTLNGSEDEKHSAETEKILEEILPEAFAAVREASKRTVAMRHFDVQLIGGMVLHKNRIAEMKTGEGKTLVAVLPLYLNALPGLGSHLITVNDYLAARDATWMSPVFMLLGMNVGVVNHEASYILGWENPEAAQEALEENLRAWPSEHAGSDATTEKNLEVLNSFRTSLSPCTRREAYEADVTYGTNNEFGFDYLRDNMKFSLEDYVQRGHNFAIVDEVDSILIDEARTPLIISGPSEDSTDLYYKVDAVVKKLSRETDFSVDEKLRSADLSEEGASKIEAALGISNLYDPANLKLLHHANQSLRANTLFSKDVDYMMQDGKVVIVDEFTGRLMPGRRWSDGLHQAVEAKEGVEIESENQTMATITIQNYFRMYRKLAGMTGTADTEAFEFKHIYDLDVTVVPTHKPLVRKDHNDVIYRTEREKFVAACEEIKKMNSDGRPVLVGTSSIEQSEKLSDYLDRMDLEHNILNAKQHGREASIVAQAGRVGAITIATNMAGRGTDILLGGNPEFLAGDILRKRFGVGPDEATPKQYEEALSEAKQICDSEKEKVKELGGLHILSVERHEARRIDNQFRGRAGRQGDDGSSRFYVSLEDNLMRIFASEKITGVMDKLGWQEGEPIEHSMISKSIENAQKKVEGRNFDIRKHLLRYDDVLNKQRDVVYRHRRQILEGGENLKEMLLSLSEEVVSGIVNDYVSEKSDSSEFDSSRLSEAVTRVFGTEAEIKVPDGADAGEMTRDIAEKMESVYAEKEEQIGSESMRQVERYVMLQTIDYLWKEHLLNMDHLREGVGLRGYAQKDPLREYTKEGFEMFSSLMDKFGLDVCSNLFRIRPVSDEEIRELEKKRELEESRMVLGRGGGDEPEAKKPVRRAQKKIGRNSPCPCGSGKKYKKCCGM